MNPTNLSKSADLISKSYADYGTQSIQSREMRVKQLLTQRALPEEGWDDLTVRMMLADLAAMDSNNSLGNCGVGERQGRVFSSLVKERHFHLAHGIGRSGDLNAIQPKAAGSSLILKLAHALLKSALKTLGYANLSHDVIIIPSATGIAITLTLLTLKKEKPDAKYILMPRIDQKTCLKSIVTAGLTPIVVEPIISPDHPDQLITDLHKVEELIELKGRDSILAVMSTSSCFAPRACDSVEQISRLCKEKDIAHVVNNAYGVQCRYYAHRLQEAERVGRIDALISSTDKNFMVPVGGSFIYAPKKSAALIQKISKNYPG